MFQHLLVQKLLSLSESSPASTFVKLPNNPAATEVCSSENLKILGTSKCFSAKTIPWKKTISLSEPEARNEARFLLGQNKRTPAHKLDNLILDCDGFDE